MRGWGSAAREQQPDAVSPAAAAYGARGPSKRASHKSLLRGRKPTELRHTNSTAAPQVTEPGVPDGPGGGGGGGGDDGTGRTRRTRRRTPRAVPGRPGARPDSGDGPEVAAAQRLSGGETYGGGGVPAKALRHLGVTPSSRWAPGVPWRQGGVTPEPEYDGPSPPRPFDASPSAAASVRGDGSPRQGSLALHDLASDPTLLRPQTADATQSSRPNSSHKSLRRLELSRFLRQPKRQLLSPSVLSRSSSAMTNRSDSIPGDSALDPPRQLSRPADPPRRPDAASAVSLLSSAAAGTGPARVKIFEHDDVASHPKAPVRRPPGDVHNWFDLVDISSDEELGSESDPDRHGPRELKPPPPPPSSPPQELPADEKFVGGPALPSTFSPWGKSDRDKPPPDRSADASSFRDSVRAVERGNEKRPEHRRETVPRRRDVDSMKMKSAPPPPPASAAVGPKPPAPPKPSRLASESVLSLSDSEPDDLSDPAAARDTTDAVIGSASPVTISKLASPPRALQQVRSASRGRGPRRQSASTTATETSRTSGSIPIQLTDSAAPGPPGAQSPPATWRRSRSYSPHANDSVTLKRNLRKLGSWDDADRPASRSRSPRGASAPAPDSETLVSGERKRSLPTDASRIMAVTEEEMVLLEMMRRKRTALAAQGASPGGGPLPVSPEVNPLTKRLASAHHHAAQSPRAKKAKEEKIRSRASGRYSLASSYYWSGSDEEIHRKYSAIRKEDVDKGLKMERFLAAAEEAPSAGAFAEQPSRTGSVASSQGEKGPASKFERLLPETYSLSAPSKGPRDSRPVSPGGSVRSQGEDDLDEHYHHIRQFLASSSSSDSRSMFQPSSVARSRTSSRRGTRRSVATLAPSPVAEEAPEPDIPVPRERRSMSSLNGRNGSRRSISGRRLSLQPDSSPSAPMPSAVASLASAQSAPNPFPHSTPPDFALLQLPDHRITMSFLNSTSGASPHAPAATVASPPSGPSAREGSGSSDNEPSVRDRTNTPDTEVTSLSADTPDQPRPLSFSKAPPLKLDTAVSTGVNHRSSMRSNNSAGEDVLAAWAELGGSSGVMENSRRM